MQDPIKHLCCPHDLQDLLYEGSRDEFNRPIEGQLKCSSCKRQYEVQDGVIDFLQEGHYTGSFGYQWNLFRQTNLDSYSKFPIFNDRFEVVSQWNGQHQGTWCVEAGCGSGAFSEVVAPMVEWLFSVDASTAVYANRANNGHLGNIVFMKADLFCLPFRSAGVPILYCLGVIQHTPDPRLAVQKLYEKLMPGGEILLDVYSKEAGTLFWTKYWLRPFTRRLPQEALLKAIILLIKPLLLAHDILRLIPGKVGRWLAYRLIPVNTYKYSYAFSKKLNEEWAILDTFDMLSPRFDIPLSVNDVKTLMQQLNPKKSRVAPGPNGLVFAMTKDDVGSIT